MKKFLFTMLISLAGLIYPASAKNISSHQLIQKVPGIAERASFTACSPAIRTESRGGAEPEIPEGAVTLKCIFKYDASKCRPNSLNAYNLSNEAFEYIPPGAESFDVTLMPGTYDLMAIFTKINPNAVSPLAEEENFILCILEDVEVAEGKEVIFDLSLSNNRISYRPVNANGESVRLDHMRLIDNQTWETELITPGNASDNVTYINVWHKEYGIVWNMYSDLAFPFTIEKSDLGEYDGPVIFDLFVNDTSDKYRFSECQVVGNKTQPTSLIALWADGCKEQTVTNKPDNFLSFAPKFVRSPIADEKCKTNLTVWPKFGGEAEQGKVFAMRIGTDGALLDQLSICIPWGGNDEFTNLIYAFDYSKSESNDEEMITPYYIEQDGKLCSKFCSILTENRFIGPDIRGNYLFPGAKGIEYDATSSQQLFGGNAPVCNFTYYELNVPYSEHPEPSVMHYYLGRAGESRSIDRFNSLVTLDIDNERIASNLNEVWQWDSQCGNDGAVPAEHHFHLENKNVIVDGLQGMNITDVYFDKSREDCWPPELRMVNFKDNKGVLTDRFKTAEDANLCMYGGDFNMHGLDELRENGSSMIYWTYDTADWTVEYAPYGEDQFTEVSVDEKPEYFMFPAFGAFMGSNLSQVTRKSETGWYDLRVTLTDKAGNRQSQLISPAFKIDSNVGINTHDAGQSFTVKVNGRNIECPQDASIYNISGKKVSRNDLGAGVYVVKYNGGVVKVCVH